MRISPRLRLLGRKPWVAPLGLSLCWCMLILLLHAWTERAEDEHTLELARLQASTLYAHIVDTRAWNSAHGGVYVPESAWTRRNPWLPEAEQGLTMGDIRLVKINPAYMTRQITEVASATSARVRISSQTPVRADNRSDPWEGRALARLAADPAEGSVFELVPDGKGGEYRYMAPLYANAPCLGCHRDAHVGDIRGGISVSIPAAPILTASTERKRANSMAFAVLGFVGVSGIGGATWQMNRRRLQAEEANRAKTAFLAHISHDMRTPLTGIMGMLKRLEQDCPAAAQHIACVRASAFSLLTTVQEMMEHALEEEAHMPDREYPFSVRTVLSSCVDALRPACMDKGLTLETCIDPGVPDRLTGDTYRIRQVVGNLLGNAVKFTERGRVTLAACCEAGLAGERCRLTVEVRDTGPGIDPADQTAVFERFVHRDPQNGTLPGRGLGLSIARQLARGMGGDVSLESDAGGSVFRFTALLTSAPATTPFPRMTDPAGSRREGSPARIQHGRRAEDTTFSSPSCPRPSFASAPVFDEQAALEALDGKKEFLAGVCGVLREELDERRVEVEKAWTSNLPEVALGHVHALKNSAATLGCERMRACSAALELALRGGRPVDELMPAWFAVVAETCQALADYSNRWEEKAHGAHSDRG